MIVYGALERERSRRAGRGNGKNPQGRTAGHPDSDGCFGKGFLQDLQSFACRRRSARDVFVQYVLRKKGAGFQHGHRSARRTPERIAGAGGSGLDGYHSDAHGRPSEKTQITSGMMLKGAAPVFTATDGSWECWSAGCCSTGIMRLVDKIRTTVFKEESYKGQQVGTATIFQDDVRISTNVRNADGSRAITTRVSAEVADAVLKRGDTWRGRAFVVNDWYISAYAPIRNLLGGTIGMLYVGTLERPYQDILWKNLYVFLGITLLAMALISIVAMTCRQSDFRADSRHGRCREKNCRRRLFAKSRVSPRMTKSDSWRITSTPWFRSSCARTRN